MKQVGEIRIESFDYEFDKATFSLSGGKMTLEAYGPDVELKLKPIKVDASKDVSDLAGFKWNLKGNPGDLLAGDEYVTLYSASAEIESATNSEIEASFELMGIDDRELELKIAGNAKFSKQGR